MRPAGGDRHENMSHDFLVSTRRRPPAARRRRRSGEHPLQNRQSVSSLETNIKSKKRFSSVVAPGDRGPCVRLACEPPFLVPARSIGARSALERGLSHVASHIGQQDHHRQPTRPGLRVRKRGGAARAAARAARKRLAKADAAEPRPAVTRGAPRHAAHLREHRCASPMRTRSQHSS